MIRIKIYPFLFVTLLFFVPVYAFSQATGLSEAIALFDNENYKDAEPLLEKILAGKPADFMVNYFYGACRTENNHFTNADLDHLITANQEVSPIDINYYFALQYHARSNWERALKFYNKYKSSATAQDIEKRKVLEKIQQCYDKINPYEKFMVNESVDDSLPVLIADTADIKTDITGVGLLLESVTQDSTVIINEPGNSAAFVAASSEELVKTIPEEQTEKGRRIEFFVNSQITYFNTSDFKTEEGKELFEEGISKQKELELNLEKTEKLRGGYAAAKSRAAKNSIGEEILALENETYELKNDAAHFLVQAKNVENEYWQKATSEEIEEFNRALQSNLTEKNEVDEREIDSTTFIDPAILLGEGELISAKDEVEGNDLIYKIQIGAYSRGLPGYVKQLFEKLSKFRKIEKYTDPKGVVVYTTGNLTNYEDAVLMKNQIRQEGVKDAYVVPYLKGKRITLEQAKEIEEK